MSDYLSICRALPRPTDAQCRDFAAHMSGKHSWHKHLPLEPWTPFHFVAGPRSDLHSNWGNRLPDRRHVSVTSPSAHVEHFGCLDCVGPRWGFIQDSPEDRRRFLRPPQDKSLWVRGPDDERIDVPMEIVVAGTVYANAFVDPRAARVSASFWLDAEFAPLAYLRRLGHDVDDQSLSKTFRGVVTREHIAGVRAATLEAMVCAIHRVRVLVWGTGQRAANDPVGSA